MYNMQDCSWFSRYYSEILEIFKYYPRTNIEREFSLNVATYARELQAEIYTKLMDGDIKNKKSDILKAVTAFADRKRRFRMSFRRFRF